MTENGHLHHRPGGVPPMTSRVLAIALLAVVGFGFYALAVSPWLNALRGYDARLLQSGELLERYRVMGDSRNGLADRLKAIRKREATAGFLQGDSPSLVAANMQTRVKQVVQSNNATLNSVETVSGAPDETFQKVAIRVRIVGDIEAIQRILHSLESSPSHLEIDNLDIHAQTARRVRRGARTEGQNRRLVANFQLAGYMWGGQP